MVHPVQVVRQLEILGLVFCKPAHPVLTERTSAAAHPLAEMMKNLLRDAEPLVLRPAVVAFGQWDLC